MKSTDSCSLNLSIDRFPDENQRFHNVVFIDPVKDEKDASLALMRDHMLSRDDLIASVFIGGMEGIDVEYDMFIERHPDAIVLPVPAPGGAALDLAKRLAFFDDDELHDIDFARLFRSRLSSAINAHPHLTGA